METKKNPSSMNAWKKTPEGKQAAADADKMTKAETDAEFQAWKQQQEAPAKKKPLTPEERAKIIEEILDDLEYLGIIPPKKKGGGLERSAEKRTS